MDTQQQLTNVARGSAPLAISPVVGSARIASAAGKLLRAYGVGTALEGEAGA